VDHETGVTKFQLHHRHHRLNGGYTQAMKFTRGVILLAALAGAATPAAGQSKLSLTVANGRATLIAEEIPLRQILDEWARVGQTTIVNGDKVTGPPVTVQLVDRPESEVLDLLLRSASGYIAAPRDAASAPGASMFAKVMILPVSRGPVGSTPSTPPPAFGVRTTPPPPQPMPTTDDDDAPQQVLPPGMGVQGQPQPLPGQPTIPGQQAPVTAPRPGMLPAPPTTQPNPYGAPVVQPGVVRPGGPGGGPGGQNH